MIYPFRLDGVGYQSHYFCIYKFFRAINLICGFMDYKVKDISLAEQGILKVEWAEQQMPVLMKIRNDFDKAQPLNGLRIAACLHVTKETAVLVKTLKAGGANLALCASNPLSTQDDIAAALAKESMSA